MSSREWQGAARSSLGELGASAATYGDRSKCEQEGSSYWQNKKLGADKLS